MALNGMNKRFVLKKLVSHIMYEPSVLFSWLGFGFFFFVGLVYNLVIVYFWLGILVLYNLSPIYLVLVINYFIFYFSLKKGNGI